MKSVFVKMICRILMISMVMLPFQTVYAGMITTDKVAASAAAQADRDAVLSVINRSEVSTQLQERGIDPQAAAARVNSMTDQEVRSLAQQLDSAPAGARNSGWAWAVVIIVAIVIWYNWK